MKQTLRMFTANDVLDIRALRRHGHTHRWIAERYGCSPRTIWDIVERRTYRDVG